MSKGAETTGTATPSMAGQGPVAEAPCAVAAPPPGDRPQGAAGSAGLVTEAAADAIQDPEDLPEHLPKDLPEDAPEDQLFGESAFPVVGIGASAGGLDAYRQLIEALPTDTGMAFVLVQHLDPQHRSLLAELIGNATRMPVVEATDGLPVAPNRIYTIPPNATLGILHGRLQILERVAERGRHLPVDDFLRSLAQDCGTQAIGVVLSGTASDGTAGA